MNCIEQHCLQPCVCMLGRSPPWAQSPPWHMPCMRTTLQHCPWSCTQGQHIEATGLFSIEAPEDELGAAAAADLAEVQEVAGTAEQVSQQPCAKVSTCADNLLQAICSAAVQCCNHHQTIVSCPAGKLQHACTCHVCALSHHHEPTWWLQHAHSCIYPRPGRMRTTPRAAVMFSAGRASPANGPP
jgi:hypothetical protein